MKSTMTFSRWFHRNLREYAQDIATHGADCGFPHLTYTADCVKLYNRFEDEIHEALVEDAESFGYESPEELVATFRRKDRLQDLRQRKNLLVWYMAEREAQRLAQ